MREEHIGGLRARVTGGTDGKGGGRGPLVLLLHGFGAPGDDLVSLADVLTVPAGTRFVFPEGPLSLSFGPSDARAWWLIDMARIAADQAAGRVTRSLARHPQRPRSGARGHAGVPQRSRTQIWRRSTQDRSRRIFPGRNAFLRRDAQNDAALCRTDPTVRNAPCHTGMDSTAPETQRAAGLSKPWNAGRTLARMWGQKDCATL